MSKSQTFKYTLNLQLFAEDEDMILPDDFVDTAPQADETAGDETPFSDLLEGDLSDSDAGQVGEDTTPPTDDTEGAQEPETTQQTQPQTIKIKFNHEEREIPVEEAAALAQKGLNYEKAIERARQEAAKQARDEVIASMNWTWNGKPITTFEDYQQALAEQELIDKYKGQNLPPEVIQELIETRRFREELQREKAAKEEEARKQQMYNEFFQYFESINERPFDPNKDSLPQEVLDAVKNGVPLKYAYMDWHVRELQKQLKIQAQNQANKQKAPVRSVTTGGSVSTEPEDDFLAGFNSV